MYQLEYRYEIGGVLAIKFPRKQILRNEVRSKK